MTTKSIQYVDVNEAFWLHVSLMKMWGESRCGIDQKDLLESALARPKHSAAYEDSDIFGQAATLIYGLIKNHPWLGGNKRTAAYITDVFLEVNGYAAVYSPSDSYKMVLAIDLNKINLDEIGEWYRVRSKKLK